MVIISYCYLFVGLKQLSFCLLQLVQKTAAHFVTGTRRYDLITPGLVDLNCLPV